MQNGASRRWAKGSSVAPVWIVSSPPEGGFRPIHAFPDSRKTNTRGKDPLKGGRRRRKRKKNRRNPVGPGLRWGGGYLPKRASTCGDRTEEGFFFLLLFWRRRPSEMTDKIQSCVMTAWKKREEEDRGEQTMVSYKKRILVFQRSLFWFPTFR